MEDTNIFSFIHYLFSKSAKGRIIMSKITIERNRCKGCGLCVETCPKKLLALDSENLNEKGYSPAVMTDISKCIACAFCAKICPDCVITVEKD